MSASMIRSYAVLLLILLLVLRQVLGVTIVWLLPFLIPLVVLIAGGAWLVQRTRIRSALLGELPPTRRATALVSAALVIGAIALILLLPNTSDQAWLVIIPVAAWIGISVVAFAVASVLPDGVSRAGWVTAATSVFMGLGFFLVLSLGLGAALDSDLDSRGAMVAIFFLTASMLLGVPAYLRLNAGHRT